MKVTVKYFAGLRETVGISEELIELGEGADISSLFVVLEERHASVKGLLGRVSVAIDHQYASLDSALHEGAEIALLPPVAGGVEPAVESSVYLESEDRLLCLCSEPLDTGRVVSLVEEERAGGIVTFTGNVRRQSQGREVMRLEYEAYPEMVIRELKKIVDEMSAQWPQARVAIHHRVGVLDVGESAVVIAVGTPHRKEAFEACSHAIERLKETVPIWKKEFFTDGTTWVGWGP